MAEPTQQYHLFPSPVTKVKPNNNPFRNSFGRPGRHIQAVSPINEEETKSPDGAQTVVIKITEPVSPIQDPPPAVLAKARSRSPSPVSEPSKSYSPTSVKAIKSPCYPPPQSSEKGSPLPSPALREKASSSSIRSNTIPPMRSMFPQYDHSLPSNQQRYFPQGAARARAPPMAVTRDEYSPRVVSPSPSDALTGGPKTAPSSVIDFPTDNVDLPQKDVSSLDDLGHLWKATNGEGPNMPVESFTLEMSRISPAIFSFGLSSSQPFYTLKCYSTNELGITRYHPARPKKLPILLLALEDRVRRLPPHDGLVGYIFPKLAATLATNQAAELAQQYGLAPTDKDDMTKEAIARAAAQEASRLIWNDSEQLYEFSHPALGRNWDESAADDARPELSLVTQSNPQQQTSPARSSPTLRIIISQPTPASPPVISIISSSPFISESSSSSPYSTPNLFAQPANLRASTQALQHDPPPESSPSPAPLATLSLSTLTLTLHARRMLSLLPSLYAIDSCVSALFAVAVADERTNPWLDSLPVSPSRPLMTAGRRRCGGGGGYAASVAGSVATNATGFTGKIYTTLAERMDAENEEKEERELMGKIRKYPWNHHHQQQQQQQQQRESSVRDSDSTLIGTPPLKNAPGWKFFSLRPLRTKSAPPKNKNKNKAKTKKITVTEYDVERYGTYQAGSRQGQKLPGPVRAVLAAMFLILRVLVCVLTGMVECAAWALSNGTRAVTSERF